MTSSGKNWKLVESQRAEYFEKMLMHYLYYNISEISQRDYNKYFDGKKYLDYLIQLEEGTSLKLTKQ